MKSSKIMEQLHKIREIRHKELKKLDIKKRLNIIHNSVGQLEQEYGIKFKKKDNRGQVST